MHEYGEGEVEGEKREAEDGVVEKGRGRDARSVLFDITNIIFGRDIKMEAVIEPRYSACLKRYC